jgi:N-acetyltransferase
MSSDGFRSPISLRGRHVELVPLDVAQVDELHRAARDPEIGRFLRDPPGATPESAAALVTLILDRQRAGTDLAFATRKLPDGPVIGMTRYLNIDRPNENVEVGGTWLDSAYWRTPVNTESKYLLLRHAFEDERVRRVQLQTDLRNLRSQRAIERLGAIKEAALRENVRLRDGYYRTSVVYGILASEWPGVRTRLEDALARPWSDASATSRSTHR